MNIDLHGEAFPLPDHKHMLFSVFFTILYVITNLHVFLYRPYD